MSKLKEQYDALIAAGMPEHGKIFFSSIDDAVGHDGATKVALLDAQHARDLLTMHALRWWWTSDFVNRAGSQMMLTDRNAQVGDIADYGEFDLSFWGTDILDAIVHAVKV